MKHLVYKAIILSDHGKKTLLKQKNIVNVINDLYKSMTSCSKKDQI